MSRTSYYPLNYGYAECQGKDWHWPCGITPGTIASRFCAWRILHCTAYTCHWHIDYFLYEGYMTSRMTSELPHVLHDNIQPLALVSQDNSTTYYFNTLRPRQNGRRFTDDTFKRIFLNESIRVSIKISLKFVPKGPISNDPALVQIMACRRSGDKPLSEPMMVSLLTHICVTRPQWINERANNSAMTHP